MAGARDVGTAGGTDGSTALDSPSDREWRPDLDPVRLPVTRAFTESQLAILRACLQLFADYGYHGTSVRDIADAVGIKSASLYKSFPSKQAMLDALTRLGYQEYYERMMNSALAADGGPADRFAAQIRAHMLVHCELPRLTSVIAIELRNVTPAVADYAANVRAQAADLFNRILDRGEAEGQFRVPNRPLLMVAISSLGIAVAQWFPYHPDVSADQLTEDYAQLALRMVGAEV